MLAIAKKAYQAFDRDLDAHIEQLFASKLPPTLYHYTSWEGLEGILTGRCMRATDYRRVLDQSEFRCADALVHSVVGELLEKYNGLKGARVLARLMSEYDDNKVSSRSEFDLFLACFCMRAEAAHLWKTFGRSGFGYCIGLRTLDEAHPKSDAQVGYMVPVRYDAADERGRLLGAFNRVITLLHQTGRADRDEFQRTAMIALYRIAALSNLSLKATEYAPEEEVRLVVWLRREGHKLKVHDEPRRCVEWSARPNNMAIALEAIYVGAGNGVAALARVEDLLRTIGYGSEVLPQMPAIQLSQVPASSAA